MEFTQIVSDVETAQVEVQQDVAQPEPISAEMLEWVSGAGKTSAPGHGW